MSLEKLWKAFGAGLLLIAPLCLTIWIVVTIVRFFDDLLHVDKLFPIYIPGLGLILAVVMITAIGLLGGYSVGRALFDWIERVICRIPLVRLLMGSLKDLFQAFVGDSHTFQHPVYIDLGNGIKVFGFVTCDRFDDQKLKDHVAVYLPQSYNFAGNLMIVDRSRVQKVDAIGSDFMAFIVSGGVAQMAAGETVLDGDKFDPRESHVPPEFS